MELNLKVIEDKVLDILEEIAGRRKGILPKLIENILPPIFILLKGGNLKSYFMTREIFDMSSSFVKFATLSGAYKTGILHELMNGWKTPKEISDKLRLDNTRLENLLDALVAFGFVIREEEKLKYSEGKRTNRKYRIKRELEDFIKKWEGYQEFMWSGISAFTELPNIIRYGKPSDKLNIYDLNSDYASLLFGVNEYLYRVTRELMRKYRFGNINKIMIGSMGISFAKNIQREFLDVKIHIGCYPHLIKEVPRLIKRYRLPEKNILSIKEHKGNPDEDIWGDEKGGYDLVFLTKKLTLRPLDEFGEKFLSKAYRVLKDGGYVVIWESIVGDDGVSGAVEESVLDLLVSFTGIRWTETDIKNYVIKKGFSKVDIAKCFAGRAVFCVGKK